MSVTARLLRLAIPIAGLHLLNALVLTVDVAVVGRIDGGQEALTALGFASELLFLLMVGAIGLGVGVVALISRAWGTKDALETAGLAQEAINITWLLGIAVAGLGNLLAVWALRILQADESTIEAALPYLRPMLAGAVLAYLNITLAAILRGAGNTVLAFGIALGVVGLNIALDIGLVLGRFGLPRMGVEGAAYASLIAQGAGVLTYLVATRLWEKSPLLLTALPRFPTHTIRELWRVSRPAMLDLMILEIGFFGMVAMLGYIDQRAVAAHTVGMRIHTLAFLPGLALMEASATLVGGAIGVDDHRTVRRILLRNCRLCIGIQTVLAAVMLSMTGPLVATFGIAPESPSWSYTHDWIRILAAGMPITGAYLACLGTLQGLALTSTAFRINLLSSILVQLPLGFLLAFAFHLGAVGVWLAFPIAYVPRLLLSWWALRSGDFLSRK